MSRFAPKDFAEAAANRAAHPSRPRTPLARGKGLKSAQNAVGLKRGSKSAITAKGRGAKKAKRPKKLTDGQLKKKVWTQFSIFIRTRRADQDGFVRCVTCDARRHWTLVDAGHFIAGRLNHNLFDPRGCNEQCKFCNGPRAGNAASYYKWMLANHGQEVIDELMARNNQTHKWQPGELQDLLDKYTALNAANSLLKG